MSKTYFVTGTDTDAGKTLVACGLLEAFNQAGLSTLALKPIAAGCEETEEGLRNDDALQLINAMSCDLEYDQVNPIAVAPPIAPHIALDQLQKRVTAGQLAGYCRGALMKRADVSLVEGAGGWRVPLNARETLAHLAVELNTPVIMVVGMKLGCINHALLTVEAIRADNLPLVGWVANHVDGDMSCPDENFATLMQQIPAPCLGRVPRLTDSSPQNVASHLDVSVLISS